MDDMMMDEFTSCFWDGYIAAKLWPFQASGACTTLVLLELSSPKTFTIHTEAEDSRIWGAEWNLHIVKVVNVTQML